MKKSAYKAIKRAVERERERCTIIARGVEAGFTAMGFRHDAAKAAGARAVLDALNSHALHDAPYQVLHVSGLTQVTGDYYE